MRKIDFERFQTAKIQGLRSTNRAIVLNFIRYHQPIARVEIAQRTGLQRSTVSLIVDDLIRDGRFWNRERLPCGVEASRGCCPSTPKGTRPLASISN